MSKNIKSGSDFPILLDEESRFGIIVFFLICFIPIIATLAFGSVDMWAIGLIGVLTSITVCMWSIDSLRRGVFRLRSHWLQAPLAALILIGIVQLLPIRFFDADTDSIPQMSASLSLDPFATKMFVIRMLLLLIYFAAVLTYTDSLKRFRVLITTIIIFGAIMSFFGIIQKLAIPDEGIYGIRPTPFAIPFGSFVNQHHFAAFMEMTAGLGIGLLFTNGIKKDKRMLLWIAVFIMGLGLVYTSSRGGFLSFIGIILFCALMVLLPSRNLSSNQHSEPTRSLFSKFGLKVISLALGLLFLFLLAISFVGADSFFLRSIGLSGTQADYTGGRSHFWSSGLQIFFENPIIGVGFESFNDAFTKFDTWNGTYQLEYAHNEYLQMLTDGGILGFACVAGFIILLFRTAIKKISKTSDLFELGTVIGAAAGCFGIAIHSFFDFPLRTVSNSYFLILLVAIIILAGNYIPQKR